MYQNIEPHLEHVKGQTFCIVTGYSRLPVYKLDEQNIIMIDSGLPREWEGIETCLEKADLFVKAVLTSHYHPDHIGNHLRLRRKYGTKLYLSPFAASAKADPMNMLGGMVGITTYRRVQQHFGEPFAPDFTIDWNAPSIEVEGAVFQILQLPGHCSEHMGFITPDNVGYVADTVLSKNIIEHLRSTFTTCVELDLASKESLTRLSCDKYIVAHNAVCDSIRELALQNREHMLQRLQLLEDIAGEYMDLDTLIARFLEVTHNIPDSVRKVAGTRHNLIPLVDYLMDTGRFTARAKDGFVQYKKA
jgi:glyoxylase-like metal-dependent hydrolase (beta-lactamase superfamily II)